MYDVTKTFNKIIARYSNIKEYPGKIITVFHGRKYWNPGMVIKSPAIEYLLARGNGEEVAFGYAEGLLERLTDFSNLTILEEAAYQAQQTGYCNPFVSTTLMRDVARSFTVHDGKPGFLLTIQGPEGYFYDFNGFREHYGIPRPSTFGWLQEFGIPFQILPPFELARVDKIVNIREDGECLFSKG